MRMSSFFSYLYWFIGMSVALYFCWTYEPSYFDLKNGGNIDFVTNILSIFLAFGLVAQSVILTYDLRDVVVFKYKIVEGEYSIEAKCLTLFWLFIPYWKSVDTDSHSYKSQNFFGAKEKHYYETDVTYKTKEEALSAIENHKESAKEGLSDFFKRPDKDESKTTYL